MAVTPGQLDVLQDLRRRHADEGGTFWLDDHRLAAFDPRAAQALNSANYDGLALPEKLSDLMRRRRAEPIYWRELRAVWIDRAKRLSEVAEVERLDARMSVLLDAELEIERDWVWGAHEVISRSLVPTVVDGLDERATRLVLRDQTLKLHHNLLTGPPPSLARTLRGVWIQLRAGWVVRRELRARAAGRKPRRLDFTDPIVDRLSELGIGRAVDAVTGVLTAIAGPPGGAASCLLYAMARYPQWEERLRDELRTVDSAELYGAPTRVAPVTHRFVRETLRLWSPTPIMRRAARKDLEHGGVCVHAGKEYVLSPEILHLDPAHWPDPESFDPDRWCPGAKRGAAGAGAYAPFGWAPRGCVGAGLGTVQLILFCHLMTTRYRIEWRNREAIAMALPSMPVPQHLVGTLQRRS